MSTSVEGEPLPGAEPMEAYERDIPAKDSVEDTPAAGSESPVAPVNGDDVVNGVEPATTAEATSAEEVEAEPSPAPAEAEKEAEAAPAPTPAPAPVPAPTTARSSRKRGWDQLDDPSNPSAKHGGKSVADLAPAQREHIERAKKFCAEQTAAFRARQSASILSPQLAAAINPQLQLQKTLQTMQQTMQQNAVQQQVAQLQAAQQQQVAMASLAAAQQQQQHAIPGGGGGALKNMLDMQEQSQRQRAYQLLCRVYVGSINFDMKEDQVKQAFLPFGPIRSIDLAWDNVAMKHKGFAFVEYECPEAAQIALDQMNGVMLGGRNIKCGRPTSIPAAAPVIAQMQTEAESYNRVYVASIHLDLNESDVKSVFEAFGKIKEIELPADTMPGKHRGYAFIEYETKQASVDAIASMNLFDLGGQYLRVGKCTTPPMPPGQNPQIGSGAVPPVSVSAAAAAAAATVPGAAQAQLAVSAIQSRLAGLDNPITSVANTGGIAGLGALGGLPGLSAMQGLGGLAGLSQLGQLGQLGQLANAANLLRAATLPGLAGAGLLGAGLATTQAQAQTQLANMQAAAAAINAQTSGSSTATSATISGSNMAPNAAAASGAAGAAAAAEKVAPPKNEQSLSTEESISISGTNARFMLMQKLQRTNESTVVVLRDMVSVEDLDEELESEVTDECRRHGDVKRVVIYQERQGEEVDAEVIVKIFVVFFEHDSAMGAIKALDGRWFGGRVIKADLYDEEKFEANDLSG